MRGLTHLVRSTAAVAACAAALSAGAASASAQSSLPPLPALPALPALPPMPALPHVGQFSSAPAPTGSFQTADEARLLELLNAYRAEHGLAPVRADLGLTLRARARSQEQAMRGQLGHSGDNVWEVLAYNNYDSAPEKFLDQWKRSPAHNAVLLEPRARTAGYGLANVNGARYATLQMG